MNYPTFQKTFRQSPVIELREVQKEFPGFDSRRLSEWQDKNYIEKIISRFYRWADVPPTEESLFFTANRIYKDSYVSLWSAMSFFSLIPEGVYRIYSVSTRKTNAFTSPVGEFLYRNVRPALFFGYQIKSWEGRQMLIAEPEKALLDLFYLTPSWSGIKDIEAIRLNWEVFAEVAKPSVITEYALLFNNRRVEKLAKLVTDRMTQG